MAVHFFFEDVSNIKLPKQNIKSWIKRCIVSFGKKVGDINYIFCSDEYLKNINVEYLKHDYYTDIITFDYTENSTVHADIFISTDRVQENSITYKVDFQLELLRVLIHGVLHLTGQNDQTVTDKAQMHNAEDKWLADYL